MMNRQIQKNGTKKKIKCCYCNQTGHFYEQCTQKQTNKINSFNSFFSSGNISKLDKYHNTGVSELYIYISHTIIAANQRSMPVLCPSYVETITFTSKYKNEVNFEDVYLT